MEASIRENGLTKKKKEKDLPPAQQNQPGNVSPAQQKKVTTRLMYAAAFLIPVLIAVLVYACSEVWPLGDKCFLKTDLYHQYAPFLQELRTKLTSGGSLFYTWNVGLGVNFLALFAYYLSGPENLLVALVPRDLVIEFMMVMMILKLGLISMAMTKYLKYRSGGKPSMAIAGFGVLYALCGFMCAYYWNVMWLDCVLLFPAVLYGAETLFREKRLFPYTAALALCILTNYYISIMICIFLVLYFVVLNFLDAPENFREFLLRCVRFAAGSLLAGGAAAILLLPEVYAMQQTASSSSGFPSSWSQYFSIPEMLERMLPAVKTEQALEHWPNIYAGSIMLMLLPLYAMSRRIRPVEKACYFVLLLFLLAGFSLNIPNYLWHGLHFPNSLPARQSFIFDFLVIFMGYRAWMYRKSFTARQLGLALFLAVAFILYAQRNYNKDYFELYSYYLALGSCGLLMLLLAVEKRGKLDRTAAAILVVLLITVEVTINTTVTSLTVADRRLYTGDNADVRALVSEVMPGETEFWRFEKTNHRTKNDGAWLGMPTVSVFSSVADTQVTDLIKKLGCEASTNAYSTVGATPLADLLLGVRYRIYGHGFEELPGRQQAGHAGNTWMYKSEQTLEQGFMLPAALTERKLFEGLTPAEVQNALSCAVDAGRVLNEDVNAVSGTAKKVTVTAGKDGEYFAYIKNPKLKKVTVTTPDETTTYDHVDRKHLIPLGVRKAGDECRIEAVTEGQEVSAVAYRFDFDVLEKVSAALNQAPFALTKHSDTCIEGTVQCDPQALGYAGATALLCLTIPYDEGWKILVDGEPCKPERVFYDAFLGIRLAPGTHQITLSYTPRGFVLGAVLTAICVLFIAAVGVLEHRERRQ